MKYKLAILVLMALTVSAIDVSSSRRCLCVDVKNKLAAPKEIKSVEILPSSNTCEEVEIIVHMKNEKQYCLDPKFKRLLFNLKRKSS
ncbi:C-X-C motif chemokine 10-like [Amia ocellicauda]|uniref:C-X-C motif chemokine 10-like n=1 Tax=Amia ocellicauda TaxID=2972642 RepID=UPI00346487BF